MSDAERQAAELLLNRALQAVIIVYGAAFLARRAWRRAGLPGVPIGAWADALVSTVWRAAQHLVPAPPPAVNLTEVAERPNERTNEPTVPARTALVDAAERLQLDRTRAAIVGALVAAGWKTTDIRDVLRGTAADIGAEAQAAREALDARHARETPPRTITVRDHRGERAITM